MLARAGEGGGAVGAVGALGVGVGGQARRLVRGWSSGLTLMW
ncbi:hypothetical protein I547_6226 [Mycobacterium kansasii 824]|nr:hypothetical protein I547_6226 [Mycobacterium kansasii 824]